MAFLFPPTFGWLRIRGQFLGLYPPEFGTALFVLITISLLTAMVFWVAIALAREDATRRYASALREMSEMLAHSNEELKYLAEELKRSNTELEQFAYIASHDLQEPLRGVAGCLQILEKKHGEKLDEKAKQLIEHAVDGATRMRSLVDDLLLLSRVSSGGQTFKPVDLSEILEAALKNLKQSIQESQAKITNDPLPVLNADQSQLVQLFQNLIGNALKYRSDKPPEIHVGGTLSDGCWTLSVRDNGIGFDQQFAERIFLPFKRLHSRTEYTGTGIGLAICQKIIQRHGGEIWAESEPGKGTVFYFRLHTHQV